MKKIIILLIATYIQYTLAIWGGQPSQPGQHPWAIQVHPSRCSASIVHTNGWVFTASHCIPRAVNGQACRSLQNNHLMNCEHFLAGNLHYQPDWNPNDLGGAIAHRDLLIIKLNREFTNLPGYSPVPINPRNIINGNRLTIAGFGFMEPNVRTDVLRYSDAFIVSRHTKNDRVIYTTNNVAAAMPGDSGSGQIFQNYYVGVTCCSAMRIGGDAVATGLHGNRNWVNSVLGISSPPPPPPPPPETETCLTPNCPWNVWTHHPQLDPRRFFSCTHQTAVTHNCPQNQFYTRRGCLSPPIPQDIRYSCQNWALVGM